MKIALITLFPEMFAAVTDYGISSRAVKGGLLEIASYNPRDFTEDRHQTVDARPYGGWPRYGDDDRTSAQGDISCQRMDR